MSADAAPGGPLRLLVPDLLYVDGRFREGLALEVDEASGRIRRAAPAPRRPSEETAGHAHPDPGERQRAGSAAAAAVGPTEKERPAPPLVERLEERALVPGFVNAHSHAFQRLIRGRTQWRPAGEARADFWSWRAAMYRAALSLSPEDVTCAARFCFLEMLHAGYTAVGEFHYLHRDPAGRPYADPLELSERVLEAARDVGIRIAILYVAYARAGIGRPLADEQRRFGTPDLDEVLSATAELRRRHGASSLVSVGLAPHSVRAVPRDWLRPLADGARAAGLPLHMHLSEQVAEVDACVEAYGLRPGELAVEEGMAGPHFTAVHATHLKPAEVRALGAAGATVCACPTTERDLGDGFLPLLELRAAGVALALGSDSHTVIAPLEEARCVEYHERLRSRRRVLVAAGGERLEVGSTLLAMASEGGARALDLETGRLEEGAPADLVAIDLGHRSLEGWDVDTLPSLLALSGAPDVVSDVWVGGARRVRDRRHAADAPAAAGFRALARRLGRGPDE